SKRDWSSDVCSSDLMVDMALFRNRSYRNGALIISLFFTGSTSVWVTVALFLQTGHGISALIAALVGLPSAFATAISSQIAGRYRSEERRVGNEGRSR